MKNSLPLSLSLIALCGLTGTPLAQGTERGAPEMRRPPRPPIIAALDANSDGVLDADEIADAAKALLTLDANGDGQLSGDEIHPPRPDAAGARGAARPGQGEAGQAGGGGCQRGASVQGSREATR